MVEKRYTRNVTTLTEEENNKLHDFRVCVIGCGGIGGYIIEMLARIGIGSITAVDMDVFDETNLNRQILSTEKVIGNRKTDEVKKRVNEINSNVKISVIDGAFSEENSCDIIKDHDVVVDALDSIPMRLVLQEACKKMKRPMVHGAIGGWYGQVCTVFPGDDTLTKIYKKSSKGAEKKLGNPSFTPANIASIQVSEVIKLLLNRGELYRNRVLLIDLLDNSYNIIDL